jgi:predicted amidohydrolase YtcJ
MVSGISVRTILDAAVPDRPVLLLTAAEEMAWVNSRALTAAGITTQSGRFRRNAVPREPTTGQPTGVLSFDALDQVVRAVPEPARPEKLASLQTAISEAHTRGVTSLQSLSATDEELGLLNEVRELGELNVRVYGVVEVGTPVTEAELTDLQVARKAFPDDPLVKAGGVELICGAQCDSGELQEAVVSLDRDQWHINVRTDDEADAETALKAFDRAAAENPEPPRGRRHRLVENEPLAADGLMEPLDQLEAAVVAASEAPAGSDESATAALFEAIDDCTSEAAFASFDELRKGVLAPGMLADIVILSTDIFEDPLQVQEATVEVTIFDGKIAYQRSESN